MDHRRLAKLCNPDLRGKRATGQPFVPARLEMPQDFGGPLLSSISLCVKRLSTESNRVATAL
jgi:hypothetical protein